MNVNDTPMGTLFAKVTAGRGTIPLEGVTVYVRDYTDGAGGELLYTLKTGPDGVTPSVRLPAPDKASSLSPGGVYIPYSEYVITAVKNGFNTVENVGVPVFDGIVSIQSVDMVPLTEDEILLGNTGTTVYYENGGYTNLNRNFAEEGRL